NFIYGLGDDVPGCIKNGVPQEAAERIWDEMEDFASYAFPKGHSAAYALIVYQTAWLKVYYPLEYMAALMTSVMDWTSKITEYVSECKKMGLTVRPPDVNQGFGHFSADGDGILFGLNAIKNVGRPTVAAIVAERESGGRFKSLTDFIRRMNAHEINKRAIEGLIKAGAFDSMGIYRSQCAAVYEKILAGQGHAKRTSMAGQMSLFDVMAAETAHEAFADNLPDIPEYPVRRLLADEKEVLGIYVSGHPANEYAETFGKLTTNVSEDFILKQNEAGEDGANEGEVRVRDGAQASVGGIVSHKTVKYTKNNEPMAFVIIEDLYGEIELIVFPNLYTKLSYELVNGSALVATGRVSVKEGENAKLVCNDIQILTKDRNPEEGRELWLKLEKDAAAPYSDITELLSRHRGNVPVVVYDERTGQRMRVAEMYWVNPESEALLPGLRKLLGDKSVVLKESAG
ncbi:MAG: DNA polymerase III subunit alpha, partial [Clostridiales bacterium]|nr:DNA polymerase III subunit alpha [Clostridiales bacterium]